MICGPCVENMFHHEGHRLKLYDSEDETIPIPLKFVDVMRQMKTNINHVADML